MKTMFVHSASLRDKSLTGVPGTVPMSMLNEEQAMINHGQTLGRLNERGGLGITEILANIHRDRLLIFKEETQAHVDELNELIRKHNNV